MSPHFLSFAERSPADRVRLVLAAVYAAIVVVTSAVVLAVILFADDPGFIGIWIIFVTSPLSALGLIAIEPLGTLPEPFDTILFFTVTTGAGLVQAWLLWPSAKGISAGAGRGTGRRRWWRRRRAR
ncbi:SCO4225 family membrane protein [Actinomadura chokoriensis]|uniref:Uncharacterized protein n=1 Tax=Actinomadura chokoriensis TaxID=454156 RepID=A0ABV4QZM7_9ACTN